MTKKRPSPSEYHIGRGAATASLYGHQIMRQNWRGETGGDCYGVLEAPMNLPSFQTPYSTLPSG